MERATSKFGLQRDKRENMPTPIPSVSESVDRKAGSNPLLPSTPPPVDTSPNHILFHSSPPSLQSYRPSHHICTLSCAAKASRPTPYLLTLPSYTPPAFQKHYWISGLIDLFVKILPMCLQSWATIVIHNAVMSQDDHRQ